MSEYRKQASLAAREAGWTFRRFLPLVAGGAIVLSALGFGIHSLGMIGRTAVEREVFEQSYQRSAAIRARIATDEATLAEIERQLANPSLESAARARLEAQAAAARVRIATAKGEQ